MNVLVVDDDLGSRLVATATVASLGHECRSAADGEEAWLLWRDFRPDVLISDRVMPGLDGLGLCERIRRAESDSYTYIVLLTSQHEQEDVLTGLRAGADDYLAKPLDAAALRARLLVAHRVTALHSELGRIRAALALQAQTDPLTHLYNRSRLDDDLKQLHNNSARYGRRYSLALCDVDLFKPYNDTYGHQAGDAALRAVAETLTGTVRQGDGVYRYGGEEFLLLLPEQSAAAAITTMNRFRVAVEDLGIDHSVTPAGILTCSIGVSTFVPGEPFSSTEVLRQADASLYAAKAAGRNRVTSLGSRDVDQPA